MPLAFASAHIMVPVDPARDAGDLAERAVEAAADLAEQVGGKLHVMCALPARGLLDIEGIEDEEHETMAGLRSAELRAAEHRMASLAALAQERGLEASHSVAAGTDRVPEQIAKAAEELGATLLFLGAEKDRKVSRRMLGSVAERVAHLSPIPVMLYKV